MPGGDLRPPFSNSQALNTTSGRVTSSRAQLKITRTFQQAEFDGLSREGNRQAFLHCQPRFRGLPRCDALCVLAAIAAESAGRTGDSIGEPDHDNLLGFTLFRSDQLASWARIGEQVGFLLFDGRFTVKERPSTTVRRRDLLSAMVTSAAAATTLGAVAPATAAAEPRTSADKRRARYQPNSKEVQEFYRVNRYPAH